MRRRIEEAVIEEEAAAGTAVMVAVVVVVAVSNHQYYSFDNLVPVQIQVVLEAGIADETVKSQAAAALRMPAGAD